MAFPRGLMAIPLRVPTVLMAALLLIGGQVTVQAATVTTFDSLNVPVRIPVAVNQQGFERGRSESTLTVSGIVTPISKVTVSVYIFHQYPNDLVVSLIPPGGGNPVILANRIGGSNRADFTFSSGYGTANLAAPNGRVVFDDGPPLPGFPVVNNVVQRQYIVSGTYRSNGQSLSTLNGLTPTQMNGTWTLRVDDEADEDYGQLLAWSISVTEPGAHVWTGLGGNNSWSTAANWQGNNLPDLNEAFALITFPSGAARPSNINDMGDFRVASLNIAEGYTIGNGGIGTNKLTMSAAGVITAGVSVAGTATINMPVDLIGAATINTAAGVTLVMNGAINNDGGGAGSLTINGPGTLQLSVANGFTGAAVINSGIVMVDSNNSLGTAVGATTVNSGATLLASVGDADEPLTLAGTGTLGQGALAVSGNVTWGGPITLVAGNTSFGSVGGATLTISNIATVALGSYGFAKVGAGDIVLNAALPALTQLGANGGGTLTIGAAQPNLGGISLTGGTTIASGGNLMTLIGGISCSASPTASTITGTLDVGAGARGLDVASGSFLTFPGAGLTLTGAGGFAKTGAGTLTWSTAAGGVPLSMSDGTLTGNGTMGALTVSAGTVVPAGVINTGALNLGAGSLLRINAGGNSLSATGTVTLGGGLMQPYTNTGTIIANDGGDAVVGTFRGMPFNNNGVNYLGGDGNDVALSNLGTGDTVFFTAPATYTASENGGSISVSLFTSGGGPVLVTLDSYGSSATSGADFILPAVVSIGGLTPTNVVIYLVNDNLAEGTETINLVIIPNSGGFLGAQSTATVTIADDDDDGGKKCGFGTGLTVFFLFGCALLMRLTLRRRR